MIATLNVKTIKWFVALCAVLGVSYWFYDRDEIELVETLIKSDLQIKKAVGSVEVAGVDYVEFTSKDGRPMDKVFIVNVKGPVSRASVSVSISTEDGVRKLLVREIRGGMRNAP
jgi:hypothetical protein